MGDLLTSYGVTNITYDGIGNPLSYYNGTGYTFTWCGRRLLAVVANGTFFEDDAVVVEFTNVYRDLDGNGQMVYLEPKFYIESKDEYIVLDVANVEVGKKYRIRYLPNTKICEIVSWKMIKQRKLLSI